MFEDLPEILTDHDLETAGIRARATLQKDRVRGQIGLGPPFIKVGRLVRYRKTAVIDWLLANEHTSTNNPGPVKEGAVDIGNKQVRLLLAALCTEHILLGKEKEKREAAEVQLTEAREKMLGIVEDNKRLEADCAALRAT